MTALYMTAVILEAVVILLLLVKIERLEKIVRKELFWKD